MYLVVIEIIFVGQKKVQAFFSICVEVFSSQSWIVFDDPLVVFDDHKQYLMFTSKNEQIRASGGYLGIK